MKVLVNICRVLVGALFIFSGFVKAIDPLGTSYKMGEYFAEFNMGFMEEYSLMFAVVMIVLEIVLGFTLLIGFKAWLTSIALLILIIFFTFLTGFTTFTGLVTDCGCFGDFLKLEPKESFIKDLILTVLIFIIFIGHKHIHNLFSRTMGGVLTGIVAIASILFCLSNFAWGLPAFDFRPYKAGNYLPELMEGIPDEVEYTFVYENTNTGEQQEFDVSNLPKGDEWKFVERKEKIIKKGVPAKIANFYISDEGEEISDEILHREGYSLWVIAYDLDKSEKEVFEDHLNPLAEKAEAADIPFFVLTSNPEDEFRHEVQAAYPFYYGDAIFLKTIIRSNPGLMLVKDATVVAKWHHSEIPSFEEIQNKYLQ